MDIWTRSILIFITGSDDGKTNFSDECKRHAVAQIAERDYPVADVSRRLGVNPQSPHVRSSRTPP
ncbi:MAG: hypothetical protein C0476_10355 [Sphingomonas sp.]|nr:hypothetical protein [Sphingomonas sp.]